MTAIPLARSTRPVAKGTIEKNGRYQVACRFDEETFEALHTLAQAKNVSFASIIRALVCEGLNRRKAATG